MMGRQKKQKKRRQHNENKTHTHTQPDRVPHYFCRFVNIAAAAATISITYIHYNSYMDFVQRKPILHLKIKIVFFYRFQAVMAIELDNMYTSYTFLGLCALLMRRCCVCVCVLKCRSYRPIDSFSCSRSGWPVLLVVVAFFPSSSVCSFLFVLRYTHTSLRKSRHTAALFVQSAAIACVGVCVCLCGCLISLHLPHA